MDIVSTNVQQQHPAYVQDAPMGGQDAIPLGDRAAPGSTQPVAGSNDQGAIPMNDLNAPGSPQPAAGSSIQAVIPTSAQHPPGSSQPVPGSPQPRQRGLALAKAIAAERGQPVLLRVWSHCSLAAIVLLIVDLVYAWCVRPVAEVDACRYT